MTVVRRVVLAVNGLAPAEGASPFFTHAYWDLETTKTTFKNNIVLRTHLEHSES